MCQAPDVVVTAAHCLDSGRHPRKFTTMAPEQLLIFVGDNPVDWAEGGGAADDELHAVSETLIHPSYDKNAITNDIALVRLSSASAHTTVPNLPASLGFTAADGGPCPYCGDGGRSLAGRIPNRDSASTGIPNRNPRTPPSH